MSTSIREQEFKTRDTTELRIVAAFSSLLAVGMGLAYATLRAGFGVDWNAIGSGVGIALLLVNFPLIWTDRLRRKQADEWYRSPAAGVLVTLLIVAAAGSLPIAPIAGTSLGIAGFGTALLINFGSRRMDVLGRRWSLVLIALLGVLWCAGVIWGTGYADPLYLEKVALQGQPRSIDLFFHSAIANILSVHGVSSTGIDGLVGIIYHTGSHWIYGRLAALMGIQMIEFYQLGYPVIVPAVWFFAMATLVREVRRVQLRNEPQSNFGGVSLVIVVAAVVGSLPHPANLADGFGISPFFSESYSFALLLGFLLGAIIFAHLAAACSEQPDGRSHASAEWLIACVALPLGIAGLMFFKVSTILFTFPALNYTLLRMRLLRRPAWILGGMLTVAAVVLTLPHVVDLANTETNGQGFILFSYLTYRIPAPWWPYFISLHFFWSWVFVLVRLREEGVLGFETLKGAIKRRSMLDAEIVALTAFAALLPGVLLPISLNGFYFSDQVRWVAVPLLLGDVGLLSYLTSRVNRFRERGFFGFAPANFVLMFVGLPLVLSFVTTLFSWPAMLVQRNLRLRNEISIVAGNPAQSLRERLREGDLWPLIDGTVLQRGVERAPGREVVRALRTISARSIEERRRSALFIPKEIHEFWGFYQSEENCNWAAFVGPALADVAMVGGSPPKTCQANNLFAKFGYGLPAYRDNGRWLHEEITSDAQACASAARWHLSQLFVLEPQALARSLSSGNPGPRALHVRTVVCAEATHS